MHELIQVGPQSYYIQCPAKIGVYVRENGEAFLIDSGNDKEAGKKAKKHLEQQGWRLKGILVTHSNADHIGGCQYLQKQTGCKVFAPGIEGAFTRWPELEPAFLYGGYPCKDLRHKFLMAQPCDTVELNDPDFPGEVIPISLPGHFFHMTGYLTPDGTAFLADCLSSEATLEKYGISFLYDVQAYLDTLDDVATMRERLPDVGINCFVPAHADATADIAPLARKNQEKVRQAAERILVLCAEPLMFEELLQKVFTEYGLTMNFEQYVLIGSTVKSYLSWLKDQGRVEVLFENNCLRWKKSNEDGSPH